MCEVVRSNFEDLFPQIENDIERADFIALDTEFTGLRSSESQKPSLFDTGAERYLKLKKAISAFTCTQIGISAFIKEKGQNKYWAHTYNCYLYPGSFGPIDVRFMCQASSLEFLCNHDFDFNKFAYEGVSFLNEDQEAILKKHLESEDFFGGLDREIDEEGLQRHCSDVAQWLCRAADGDTVIVPETQGLSEYVIHMEIRQRFCSVWTFSQPDGSVLVQKLPAEKRKELETEFKKDQENKIMNKMLGFTRVFRVLTRCKKPLMGHNNLMDLMMLYEKFHRPLPAKFTKFKEDVMQLFPSVYDTKHISACLKRPLEDMGLLQSTNLGKLYQALDSNKGKFCVLFSPDISHAPGFDGYVHIQHPHEAGYDAFMVGYVFLRMAHLYTCLNLRHQDIKPLPFHEYTSSFKCFVNCVNLIRGATDHVDFKGQDPPTRRPQCLVARCRKGTSSLNMSQLARLLASYGSVDIQQQSASQAVIAVGNHRCARDILRAFHKHKSISVVKYSALTHSPVVRTLMWSGVAVLGSYCVWTLVSSCRSPSKV